jgi:phenylacetate-CoA ligase
MREKGITPEDVKSLSDLTRLPFTIKQDFRDNYPFGLMSSPMSEVVRLHASSGTTGKPIVAPYTREDIDTWAEVMARTLVSGGVTSDDVLQNAYGYGLFTGGLGIHYGAERLGAAVVPSSAGGTRRQIMLMQDFGTTVCTCTPSYSLVLAETASEMGVDLRTTKLRVGILGAEPWSESMRREIEEKTGMEAIDIFGLTEIIGPGVSAECVYKQGMHIFEDHFLAEIINPDTGEQLPYGTPGELVFTTLTKKAQPVLRYRTRDITVINAEPCECGRTFVRMSKLTGRTDDMLIIRGINVFPSQIETILLKVQGVQPQYQIVVDRERHLDDLEIQVEVSDEVFSDEMARLESLQRQVQGELDNVLGIKARVRLVEPRTIERSMGKARRVIDKREM